MEKEIQRSTYNKMTFYKCRFCGTLIIPSQKQIYKDFCDKSCHINWLHTYWHLLTELKRSGISPKKRVRCKSCRKFIMQIKYKHFCNEDCLKKWLKRRKKAKSPTWNPNLVTKTECDLCHKPLTKSKRVKKGKKTYCSNGCVTKILKLRKGFLSSRWIDGRSFGKYCPKFNQEFRENVRSFFGYQCVGCGKKQEDNFTKTNKQRKLHVHHVFYDKDTCCKENEEVADRKFVALCIDCHSKTNGNRGYWMKYYSKLINKKYGGQCYFHSNITLPKIGWGISSC